MNHNDDLYYLQLIQRLNAQFVASRAKDRSHESVVHLLTTFNSSIKDTNHQFDFVFENQRGMKLLGIPLYSKKSLLPIIDPSTYQSLTGKKLHVPFDDLINYPLPDFGWQWSWDTWYVLMYDDVDDQGWVYSSLLFNAHVSDGKWKGKYYFGNFVRRRIWVRMRQSMPEEEAGEVVEPKTSTLILG
ncbi:sporulation-specific protein 73 [Scheffersomyces xylosifermentans]|uniref:sporulation-specific protein 73 n=1 Tax=Scheffersomyces xylosifermentans TaxID=1304137 RepID=UPI00315D2F12